ncbi:hypothetical protein ACFC09_00605 [Streptomyces sp. NPDC056161]
MTRTIYTVIRSGTARRPDVHLFHTLLEQAATQHEALHGAGHEGNGTT